MSEASLDLDCPEIAGAIDSRFSPPWARRILNRAQLTIYQAGAVE